MSRISAFGIMLCVLFAAGCSSDNEEDLTPTCNTSNVTFSGTITGLINQYSCLNCHGNNPSAPFSLVSYANVKAKVDDGRLFGAINHSTGFSPMPKGLPKMSQCDINKVKAWIDAGAPNN
ncbi:MAG TPA: hypothetical protein VFR58_11410 [Flavisolibacter sp.]|nr:hypothetical protein [Flavisolibacter sp.]